MSASDGAATLRVDEAILRASPRYDLVTLDGLARQEREALADLCERDDFYAVLRPRNGQTPKTLCANAALLFLTRQQAGLLPEFFARKAGIAEAVRQLILDDVLELWNGSRFVSGPDAHELLGTGSVTPSGELARLSMDALRYAQAMPLTDAGQLAARLYFFHRLPVSPALHRNLATKAMVRQYLGLDSVDQALAEGGWHRLRTSERNDGWFVWGAEWGPVQRMSYKLYVSCELTETADALSAVTSELVKRQLRGRMKVGNSVYGLARPDRLVVYTSEREELERLATALEPGLVGLGVHGVPFTAQWGSNGALSWGIDPPRSEHVLRWLDRPSWRVWLAQRLAVGLLAARERGTGGVAPWEFAVRRVELEGVDPTTWTPTRALWQERG